MMRGYCKGKMAVTRVETSWLGEGRGFGDARSTFVFIMVKCSTMGRKSTAQEGTANVRVFSKGRNSQVVGS